MKGLGYSYDSINKMGEIHYELPNHLGNVRIVLSDRKLVEPTSLGTAENGNLNEIVANQTYFTPDVLVYNDYYAFGMLKPDRHGETKNYRYGYQGSEKDDEVKGQGNSYTTQFRQLDPRVGRWLTIDPVTQPWQSPYTSMDNNPIWFNDPLGDKFKIGNNKQSKNDVGSLAKNKNQKYITHSGEGEFREVKLDFGDLREKKVKRLLKRDEGLNLINDLVSADERYLYEGTDIGIFKMEVNGRTIVKSMSLDNNGVINASRNGADSGYLNRYLPGSENYDGQVAISSSGSWEELNQDGTALIKKSRNSLVFHELAENFERTTNKRSYYGSTTKTGAHQGAINREWKWWGKSNNPGGANYVRNSNDKVLTNQDVLKTIENLYNNYGFKLR